jgi:hypothetical protein
MYIPLMKDLHMSWNDIKNTPNVELNALMIGLNNFNIFHAFDGYTSEDVAGMAKKNPSLRGQYANTQQMQARFGSKRKPTSFSEIIQGK